MAILQDQTQDLKAQLAALQAENAKLKAKAEARAMSRITLKVSAKGGVSLYGLGRWPVTLYKGQWLKLLAMVEEIREFIAANDGALSEKAED